MRRSESGTAISLLWWINLISAIELTSDLSAELYRLDDSAIVALFLIWGWSSALFERLQRQRFVICASI